MTQAPKKSAADLINEFQNEVDDFLNRADSLFDRKHPDCPYALPIATDRIAKLIESIGLAAQGLSVKEQEKICQTVFEGHVAVRDTANVGAQRLAEQRFSTEGEWDQRRMLGDVPRATRTVYDAVSEMLRVMNAGESHPVAQPKNQQPRAARSNTANAPGTP